MKSHFCSWSQRCSHNTSLKGKLERILPWPVSMELLDLKNNQVPDQGLLSSLSCQCTGFSSETQKSHSGSSPEVLHSRGSVAPTHLWLLHCSDGQDTGTEAAFRPLSGGSRVDQNHLSLSQAAQAAPSFGAKSRKHLAWLPEGPSGVQRHLTPAALGDRRPGCSFTLSCHHR